MNRLVYMYEYNQILRSSTPQFTVRDAPVRSDELNMAQEDKEICKRSRFTPARKRKSHRDLK